MPRDDATLLDVLKAARLVTEFQRGYDFAAFLADARTQSAVLHQLLVLGEAVKRLSDAFKSRHADVDWRSIAGMRDKLIHQYDSVDLEEVWQAAVRDVPLLIESLGTLPQADPGD